MNIIEAKNILKDDLPFQAVADFADQIVKTLNLPKDSKILDIGTGEGNMAVILALNGYHVITGEPEDDLSHYAKRNWQLKAEKLKVDQLITFRFLKGDDLPFESGRFEAVFLFGCIHHMPDEIRSTVIKECIRTTTSEGLICVFEPAPAAIETIRQFDPDHPDAADPVCHARGLNLSLEITEGAFFNAFIFRKRTP